MWKSFCSLTLLALSLPLAAQAAEGPDPALHAARVEYATHFFSAESHLRLAKALLDRGFPLQAFFVSEAARRNHFSQAEFDAAFHRVFRHDDFDNSAAAEAALQAALTRSPDDFAALQRLADIYVSRSDWDHAIPLLQRASRLRPDDYSPVGALYEVYRRQGKGPKGESLLWTWTQSHPDAIQTYHMQLESMIDKDPSGAETLIRDALQKYPNDGELHYTLAALRQGRNDLAGAEQEFLTAAKLAPGSAAVQGWVGRFFLKAKDDPVRALDYYLRAYFLDPDFYETEYAESRIPKAARRAVERRLAGDNPPDLTESETKLYLPTLLEGFLEAMQQEYKPEDLERLTDVMGCDDEVNRWNAMRLVAEHADSSFDPRLSKLLQDENLFRRGMAGYVAMKRWHDRAIPILEKWLDDPAELIRYDALSALLLDGGPKGRAVVERYQRSGKEPNPRMRQMLVESLQPPQPARDKR